MARALRPAQMHRAMTTATVDSTRGSSEMDLCAQMRAGHPDIALGDAVIVDRIRAIAQQADAPLRIFEVGCSSGFLVELLRRGIPRARLVANEVDPTFLAQARRRFAGTDVTVFDRPFQEWEEPVDVVVSWGAHHHLTSTGYLSHAAALLEPDGVLILGDEFCPDYLGPDDLARLARAEVIHVAKGHVLTAAAEVDRFNETGEIPSWSRALERKRRRALWHWYKYVVDYALDRDNDIVVQTELRIAADDLRTEFHGEHKLALAIVRRELELHGFAQRSCVRLREEEDLASFFVLEMGLGPSSR
jgi:SAM-dependent methyltransferase